MFKLSEKIINQLKAHVSCIAQFFAKALTKIKEALVPSTDQDSSLEVQRLADEITRYLTNHTDVADTLDGIAHWWILRQRLHEERIKVEQAMNYLCAQGIVEALELRDGQILYRPVGANDLIHSKK